MKVAITGHTSGIGQGLYNYFKSQGHDVYGFSRSNGYTLPDAEDRVLSFVKHCDIFVNNALPIASQINFVQRLWPDWQDLDKTILVVGSVASNFQKIYYPEFAEYRRQKKILSALCHSLRYEHYPKYHKCRLISINPGYTRTNIFPPDHVMPDDSLVMSVQDVVQTVDMVLNSPVRIEDIAFRK